MYNGDIEGAGELLRVMAKNIIELTKRIHYILNYSADSSMGFCFLFD